MKQKLLKLLLLCLLGFTFVTLCASNCDDGAGDSWKEAQAKEEEERRQPATNVSGQNTSEPKITYPVEDTIIEVTIGNRAAMSVQVQNGYALQYIWQRYQDGNWIAMDQGTYNGDDIYSTPYIVDESHDGEQYRCEVIFYNSVKPDSVLTSPIFTIKAVEKKESSEESKSQVPSASEQQPVSSAEIDPGHKHNWEEETKTVNEYEEVTTITYRCKGCNFSTTEKRAMMQHVDETQAQKGHGGFRDDYVFEYKTLPINGYACNGCSFTTRDKAAMEAHDEANQGAAGHGGYQTDVVLETKEENVYGYACNGCDFTTQDLAEMQEHDALYADIAGHGGYQSNVKIGSKYVAGTTTYRCNSCGETLVLSEIGSHMTDHPAHLVTLYQKYHCTTCWEFFSTLEEAQLHQEEHSDVAYVEWMCEICAACFADEASAKAHEDENPAGSYSTVQNPGYYVSIYGYACNGCDFTTQLFSQMKAHDEANQPVQGHGGYQSDVVLETTQTEICGYACNGCDFTTQDETAIKAHDEANQPVQGHGGYQSNVQIGSQETPIYGYKCNGCDFTTRSLNAMKKHDEENAAVEGHGGYQTNVQIGTEERPIYGYKCNGCNFTTKKKSEMERHAEKNQAQVGHGGYTVTEHTKNVKTGEKTVKTGYRICTGCNQKEKITDDTVRTN